MELDPTSFFPIKSISKASGRSSSCGSTSGRRSLQKIKDEDFQLTAEQVFGFEDRSQIYMTDKHYDKAFTVMKRKMDLGVQLVYARELIAYHHACLMSRNSEKASSLRIQIDGIVRDELPAMSPCSLRKLAQRLSDDGKLIDALLFYQLAASSYVRKYSGRDAASGIANCCSGTRNTIKLIHSETAVDDGRSLIQHHIVPLMRELRAKLHVVDGIDVSFRTYCEAHCLHCTEYIEGLISDYDACEATLIEAIHLIEGRLKHESKKNRVFATLLHNLGYVYEISGRYENSLRMYHKAVEADRTAVDYRSESERRCNVQAGETSIRRILDKLRRSEEVNENISSSESKSTLR